MASRNRKKCDFFARGNCRKGNQCKFIHDNPAPATPTPTTSQATASPRGATSPRSSPSAPRQVCNIFWQSGACDRGFDCSFKHTRNPQATHTASRSAINSDEDPPDFYSIDGLVPDGRERTQRGSYDPAEVHNHIKPFLKDNYTFEGPRNIESFVRIISSINDHNKSWDNGITRIGEILRFKPVDDCTNVFRTSLSFQRGYFPILEYLSSSLVLKSTWHKNINHLYTVVEDNYDDLHAVVDSCMNSMIKRNSWRDPGSAANLDGANVFKTLTTVFLQYFNRFKSSIRNHPEIVNLVQHLTEWFDIWVAGVMTKSPVLFEDPITDLDPRRRGLIIDQIHDDINRLVTIVQRESDHATVLKRHTSRPAVTVAQRRNAEIMRLGQIYDPPGELRPEGPRHDNDSIDIADIRIAPTQNELLCEISPYLPAFLPEAQHHCLPDSMERHLDIQFRLLREELISTIRSSINAVYQDLREIWESPGQRRDTTKLEKLLSKGGGAYRTTGLDSVFFMIYANVGFAPVRAERRDLTVGLLIDPPAGAARDPQASKRVAYWKNSRRLQGGGLVALLVVSNKTLKVYLGVLASFGDDIAESSKASAEKVQVRITFFDPEVEFRALKREKLSGSSSSYAFLVDGSVMFEASRPFLERLQTIEPTEIPFGNYISSSNSLADVQVKPPRYATNPRFKYNLQCLAKDREHRISDLDITRPDAVNLARHQMLESSTLDPSQVDAVINTLTREVSLIQGPPGTGKSFTGREILRILFASKVRPIVLIAYTNHALDHLLREVLDVGITKRLVRLGSRSSDEVVAEYTLDKLEKLAERSSLQRSIGKQYAVMKRLEEDMSRVMESIQLPKVSAQQVEDHLDIHFPQALNVLLSPPFWISQLAETLWADEDTNGEWSTVRGKGKQQAGDVVSHTFYDFWKTGADIAFLAPVSMAHSPMPTPGKKKNRAAKSQGTTVLQEDPKVTRFFETLEFGNNRPQIPDQNRPLTRLRNSEDLWKMSLQERTRLALAWEEDIRVLAYNINLDRYNSLREDYKEACKEYNDIRDETRRRLLSSVDLIACTTTGAAKLTSLINSIAPRVLMVEEAGQVLEAHILTSLVNSIHHLICIGDPQQLRPSLATFGLSMDSERGKQLFKFDRSLMERLADSGLQMTQLNVQRRMRPTISHFIRRILYPNLEDHDIVKTYPSVRGMQKDVYFLNHIHPEGGSEDSVSKYNTYEVQMIRDLVLYFLKQDMYSGPGDIAVLCAYLGQLQKVRQALKDLKIAVSVDERDETQLLQQGLEEEGAFEEVVVAKHIRLGTVDIYQGQEAKIVIVSLVRNTGNYDTKSASIGFLKSSNRINVALSRAKHGMYIMGNASNLRKNTTWSTILDDLEDQGLIGQGFPIICARHPDQVNLISKPGDLACIATSHAGRPHALVAIHAQKSARKTAVIACSQSTTSPYLVAIQKKKFIATFLRSLIRSSVQN
ncbi:NFX1-type zinc finger-containing protein 1 [Psilocybe cubensis]|uniref:NFX1-type zinc finger-containing protein 1 n=1 Tax=Psilocybe cubensis TaxID=181762 RepID=A0ACB8GSW4_PSICU|nr:NFX1-type zinc finger-containing protein 1 [Psilocybe cubensis]KAH9478522.1 NFX1-type zinc finger-containing protein 1 [Psilocybe cubensis]